MSRTFTPCQTAERSIQKKYRRELWGPFVAACKRYELIQSGSPAVRPGGIQIGGHLPQQHQRYHNGVLRNGHAVGVAVAQKAVWVGEKAFIPAIGVYPGGGGAVPFQCGGSRSGEAA